MTEFEAPPTKMSEQLRIARFAAGSARAKVKKLEATNAALVEALEALLKRWDTFTDEKLRDGWGNQHDAYYDLAKHAQSQWEAARAALKLAKGE